MKLQLRGPSLGTQLRSVRLRIAEWASGIGLSEETVDDVVLATYEALANVADHAYPDGDGDALVEAERRPPGDLVVVVSDSGRWRPPPSDPGLRGRGIALIAALAQSVAVRHDDTGTRVVMHWSL